jgi:hypothetical protein
VPGHEIVPYNFTFAGMYFKNIQYGPATKNLKL